MELTVKEEEVVEVLRQLKVATVDVMGKKAGVGRNTVFRSLRKYGHYSSFNWGSRYQTLREIPKFGAEGLWFFKEDIGFSRYGGLPNTVKGVIDLSTEGRTLEELEGKLKTRVHNQLSQLARKGKIGRFKWGRKTVYVSVDEEQGRKQRRRREDGMETSIPTRVVWGQGDSFLPESLNGLTVVRLLVEMIERPEASIASLSKKLQASGCRINAEQVRMVMDFYGVKKTEQLRSRGCSKK